MIVEDIIEIEEVVSHRDVGNKTEYWIKLRGYDRPEWVGADYFEVEQRRLLDDYHKKNLLDTNGKSIRNVKKKIEKIVPTKKIKKATSNKLKKDIKIKKENMFVDEKVKLIPHNENITVNTFSKVPHQSPVFKKGKSSFSKGLNKLHILKKADDTLPNVSSHFPLLKKTDESLPKVSSPSPLLKTSKNPLSKVFLQTTVLKKVNDSLSKVSSQSPVLKNSEDSLSKVSLQAPLFKKGDDSLPKVSLQSPVLKKATFSKSNTSLNAQTCKSNINKTPTKPVQKDIVNKSSQENPLRREHSVQKSQSDSDNSSCKLLKSPESILKKRRITNSIDKPTLFQSDSSPPLKRIKSTKPVNITNELSLSKKLWPDLNSPPSLNNLLAIIAQNDIPELDKLAKSHHRDVTSQIVKENPTFLVTSAAENNVQMCAALLSLGANINGTDSNGTTALMTALNNEHDAVIELLIKKGVDLNINNEGRNEIFEKCIKNDNVRIFRLLLTAKPDYSQIEYLITDKSSAIAVVFEEYKKRVLDQLDIKIRSFHTQFYQDIIDLMSYNNDVKILYPDQTTIPSNLKKNKLARKMVLFSCVTPKAYTMDQIIEGQLLGSFDIHVANNEGQLVATSEGKRLVTTLKTNRTYYINEEDASIWRFSLRPNKDPEQCAFICALELYSKKASENEDIIEMNQNYGYIYNPSEDDFIHRLSFIRKPLSLEEIRLRLIFINVSFRQTISFCRTPVQIAVLNYNGDTLLDTLICPRERLRESSGKGFNITDDDVRGQLDEEEAKKFIRKITDGKILVGHDINMLIDHLNINKDSLCGVRDLSNAIIIRRLTHDSETFMGLKNITQNLSIRADLWYPKLVSSTILRIYKMVETEWIDNIVMNSDGTYFDMKYVAPETKNENIFTVMYNMQAEVEKDTDKSSNQFINVTNDVNVDQGKLPNDDSELHNLHLKVFESNESTLSSSSMNPKNDSDRNDSRKGKDKDEESSIKNKSKDIIINQEGKVTKQDIIYSDSVSETIPQKSNSENVEGINMKDKNILFNGTNLTTVNNLNNFILDNDESNLKNVKKKNILLNDNNLTTLNNFILDNTESISTNVLENNIKDKNISFSDAIKNNLNTSTLDGTETNECIKNVNSNADRSSTNHFTTSTHFPEDKNKYAINEKDDSKSDINLSTNSSVCSQKENSLRNDVMVDSKYMKEGLSRNIFNDISFKPKSVSRNSNSDIGGNKSKNKDICSVTSANYPKKIISNEQTFEKIIIEDGMVENTSKCAVLDSGNKVITYNKTEMNIDEEQKTSIHNNCPSHAKDNNYSKNESRLTHDYSSSRDRVCHPLDIVKGCEDEKKMPGYNDYNWNQSEHQSQINALGDHYHLENKSLSKERNNTPNSGICSKKEIIKFNDERKIFKSLIASSEKSIKNECISSTFNNNYKDGGKPSRNYYKSKVESVSPVKGNNKERYTCRTHGKSNKLDIKEKGVSEKYSKSERHEKSKARTKTMSNSSISHNSTEFHKDRCRNESTNEVTVETSNRSLLHNSTSVLMDNNTNLTTDNRENVTKKVINKIHRSKSGSSSDCVIVGSSQINIKDVTKKRKKKHSHHKHDTVMNRKENKHYSHKTFSRSRNRSKSHERYRDRTISRGTYKSKNISHTKYRSRSVSRGTYSSRSKSPATYTSRSISRGTYSSDTYRSRSFIRKTYGSTSVAHHKHKSRGISRDQSRERKKHSGYHKSYKVDDFGKKSNKDKSLYNKSKHHKNHIDKSSKDKDSSRRNIDVHITMRSSLSNKNDKNNTVTNDKSGQRSVSIDQKKHKREKKDNLEKITSSKCNNSIVVNTDYKKRDSSKSTKECVSSNNNQFQTQRENKSFNKDKSFQNNQVKMNDENRCTIKEKNVIHRKENNISENALIKEKRDSTMQETNNDTSIHTERNEVSLKISCNKQFHYTTDNPKEKISAPVTKTNGTIDDVL